MINYKSNGPVVIGGVGGSGTRVVAEILARLGYYIGNDLNDANDNLLYTLLFKRPKWFYKTNQQSINRGLHFLSKCMLRNALPTFSELCFLFSALVNMSQYGHNTFGDGRGMWPYTRVRNILKTNDQLNSDYIGWGWKEPNSFLLIANLFDTFQHAKYIHTIRHGLDMAFSLNKQQLYNWGPLFGVHPTSKDEEAKYALKYWINANKSVLAIGEQLGADKFFLLNYEELCTSPAVVVRNLLNFLGIDVDGDIYQEVIRLPKMPDSIGRYRHSDLTQFDPCDLTSLMSMGFSVD